VKYGWLLIASLLCAPAHAIIKSATTVGAATGSVMSVTLTCPFWMTVTGTNPITTSGSFGCSIMRSLVKTILIVVREFADYKRGTRIEDPAVIQKLQASHHSH
jgi:hypothetical protein